PAVPVRRGNPLRVCVRPPRRLLGRLLHVHVVAGDREGPVQRVRQDQPSRSHGADPLPAGGAGAGRLQARRGSGAGLPRTPVRVRVVPGLAERSEMNRPGGAPALLANHDAARWEITARRFASRAEWIPKRAASPSTKSPSCTTACAPATP